MTPSCNGRFTFSEAWHISLCEPPGARAALQPGGPVSPGSPGRAEQRLAQAGPQVAGADGDHQDADQAADQIIGQPGLNAGTGIATGQAAEAERDADGPVRDHRARLMQRLDGEGDHARDRDGVTVTALLDQLIIEGTDQLDYPGIVFRGPAHDRRAALAAGPDVWEIVAMYATDVRIWMVKDMSSENFGD